MLTTAAMQEATIEDDDMFASNEPIAFEAASSNYAFLKVFSCTRGRRFKPPRVSGSGTDYASISGAYFGRQFGADSPKRVPKESGAF
jgi:hypothetical protein